MLIYPPEHVIYGEYAFEDWDAEKLKFILDFFVPDNMRVDILSKSFATSGGNVDLVPLSNEYLHPSFGIVAILGYLSFVFYDACFDGEKMIKFL